MPCINTAFFALIYLIPLCVSISNPPEPHSYKRSEQVPDNNNFLRRALLSVAVVGDYVYIEGGELSSDDDYESIPVTVTLSIPLHKSWTNDSVTLHAIDKGLSPYLKQPGLWVDDKESSIVSWGGQGSYGNVSAASDHHLWVLNTDGHGKGSWSTHDPPDDSVFRSSYRTVRGASATCHGVGYYLGGYAESNTDDRITDGSRVFDGLLTYNMTAQKWTNESTEALGYATWSGTATCIPPIGSAGLLVFLGGAKGIGSGRSNESDPVSFTNVTIYDPESNDWYWQLTTGGPPDPRVDFCSVGVPGKNGTYEIFTYGGWNTWNANTRSYGDVWVLTLPAFRWFKADSKGPARAMHGCALVGNRQMLSVGGNDNTKMNGWRDKDPWEQGIGVLDLPSMTWAEKYDADAADYDSPQVVRDWYRSGAKTQWDNQAVAKLFASMDPGTPDTPEKKKPSSEPSSSPNVPIGAMIGGVIGGIIFIVFITIICILIRRRRKNCTKRNNTTVNEGWNKAELPADSQRIVVRYEMDSYRQHEELPAGEVIKMAMDEKGQKERRHVKRYELEG